MSEAMKYTMRRLDPTKDWDLTLFRYDERANGSADNAHREFWNEIERLRDENTRLTKERDEADRRAGAAERLLSYERQDKRLRESWLDRAKEQWGVHRNTSFDIVWAEALALKKNVLDGGKGVQGG